MNASYVAVTVTGPRSTRGRSLGRIALGCVLTWLAYNASLQAGDLPHFEGKVISTAVKFGYQMIAVDLNADGRKDLLAIDEQSTEVAWFENPSWERHVLATDVPRPLNAACWDTDSDGIPEVVLLPI